MKKGVWLGLVLLTLSVNGCGGSSSSSGGASVRAVNAVPGLTSATFTVGATIVVQGQSYEGYSGYQSVSTGSNQMLLLTDATGNTLAQSNGAITTGTAYTLYAVGSVATPSLLLLAEDHSTPATGDIRMNFMNLSPTVTSVDAYVVASSVTDLSNVTPNATNLTFQVSQPATIPAGAYTVDFTATGSKTIIASYAAGSLSAGTVDRFLLLDAAVGGATQTVASLAD